MNLKFESIQTKPSLNRQRKVVWFNPRYNTKVKTNIGKLLKAFLQMTLLQEIFNTRTIKLRYSCTPNVKNSIKQHSSIIKNGTSTHEKDSNCRSKNNCPLDGKRLVECIFYEDIVCTTNQTNTIFVSAEGDFKSRYNNIVSFCSKGYKYNWSLKDSNTKFNLKWHIKTKVMPYKCGSRKCDLCLAEKVAIV